MLKTLAIGSFLLGAVIVGCAAAYYFIMVDSLEMERLETKNLINEYQENLAALQMIGKMTTDFSESIGASQDVEGAKNQLRMESERYNAIEAEKEKLQKIELRMRSAKRGSVIGGAVGLFLCLIQAPFLLVAGKQS